jgi:hypothetical protein
MQGFLIKVETDTKKRHTRKRHVLVLGGSGRRVLSRPEGAG